MGGVPSVYIRPNSLSGLPIQDDIEDETTDAMAVPTPENALQIQPNLFTSSGNREPHAILELRLPTTIPADEREAQMGSTIQHLALENVKLQQKLSQVENELKQEFLSTSLVQPDVIGETIEQKIGRLERTLCMERRDKWQAIEASEKHRVDLVNCQKAFEVEKSSREYLEFELKERKRHIGDLEVLMERLKLRRDSDLSTEENFPTPEMSDMATWRASLQNRREARQKAIAAKSLEMNQLREELKKERTLRAKFEREVMQWRENHVGNSSNESKDLQRENIELNSEMFELKKEIEESNAIRNENRRLLGDINDLNCEIRRLNTTILQLQNDLKTAKIKHDRLLRDQALYVTENERNSAKQKEIEEEQQRLWNEYDKEKCEIAKRTAALKHVIEISRQMLLIREKQVVDLKQKLKDIEESLAEKQLLENTDLKIEYEKQLENIKGLKALYEERVELMEAENSKLNEKISEDASTIDAIKNEFSDLNVKYEMVAEELDSEKQNNISIANELDGWIAQAKCCERELNLMNRLLSQMLIGPNGADLDRLTELLQQNHVLIAEMTTCEDCSDVASALPKLLLDLIAQIEEAEQKEAELRLLHRTSDPMTDSTDTISEQSEALLVDNAGAVLPIVSFKNATIFKAPIAVESKEDSTIEDVETLAPSPVDNMDPAVQDIVSNLPKVWKVLTELLSHHSPPERAINEERNCYKSIDTPNGPKSVISVSNTFLRLKDLILEKKSLTREVSRLKHLNSHLESRLDDQEKRLSQVQCELHKTWGVVGRMRAQHQQLHNNEKILRYELQEKRVMLGELKQELEYCRDKWDKARRKNNETELEWRKLRKEFNARKARRDAGLSDSGESGFSDEHNESGEDVVTDRSSTPSPIDFLNPAQTLHLANAESIDVVVENNGDVVVVCDARQVENEASALNIGIIDNVVSNSTEVSLEIAQESPMLNSIINDTIASSAVHITNAENIDVTVESNGKVVVVCDVPQEMRSRDEAAALNSAISNDVECSSAQASLKESSNTLVIIQETPQSSYANDATETTPQVRPENTGAIPRTTLPTNNTGIRLRSDDAGERVRDAKELRLQRLEEQCQLLVRKVDITSHKSKFLSNRLAELHEQYGSGEGDSLNVATEDAARSVGDCAIQTKVTELDSNGSLPLAQCESSHNTKHTVNDIVVREATQETELSTSPNCLLNDRITNEGTGACSLEALHPNMGEIIKEEPSNSHSPADFPLASSDENVNSIVVSKALQEVKLLSSPNSLLNDRITNGGAGACSLEALEPSVGEVQKEEPSNSHSPVDFSLATSDEHVNSIVVSKAQQETHLLSSPNSLLNDRIINEGTGACTLEALQPSLGEIKKEEPSNSLSLATSDENVNSIVVSKAEQNTELLSSPNSFLNDRITNEGAGACSLESNVGEVKKEEASNSHSPARDFSLATFEERMAARAERLKILEEQCSSLFGQVSNTVQRGNDLSNRLEEIHEEYISSEGRSSQTAEDQNENNNAATSDGKNETCE